MSEKMHNQEISSLELMRKTGISRATLNNYIKSGILPRPVVRIISRDQAESTARRLGYFPEWAPDRVEEVKALKKARVPMTEIAARFRSDQSFEPYSYEQPLTGVQTPPYPGQPQAKPTSWLSLTVEPRAYPALVVNTRLEIEWINQEAVEKVFHQNYRSWLTTPDRSLLTLLKRDDFRQQWADWETVVTFHLQVLGQPCRENTSIEVAEELFGAGQTSQGGAFGPHILMKGRAASDDHYRAVALNTPQGALFIYLREKLVAAEINNFPPVKGQEDQPEFDRSALVFLGALAVDYPDLTRLEAELLPHDYFELVKALRKSQAPVFEKYHGLPGRSAGTGQLYYFIDRPDRCYLLDAILCGLELKQHALSFCRNWQAGPGHVLNLSINIGLTAAQEFFGAIWASEGAREFQALGAASGQANLLAAMGANGSFWVTKEVINRLQTWELDSIDFGIHRLKVQGGDFQWRSLARVCDLLEADRSDAHKFRPIAYLPVTEILGVGSRKQRGESPEP